MKYGYARVSSKEQDLTIQLDLLKQTGCDMIRSEKISAKTLDARDELKTLLDFMRSGDILVVTRIDRLARSVRDLANVVHDLTARGISLVVLQQNIDTSNPTGRAFLSMLGVFAEFENEIRRERQAAGIAKAKAEGKYVGKGRPAVADTQTIKQLAGKQLGATAVLNRLTTTVEERREVILSRTGGRGVDVAVEAAGDPSAVKEGLRLVRLGGAYLSIGFSQPPGTCTVDFYQEVVRKNVKIQGVWVSGTRHTFLALHLVEKHRDLFSTMITHRFGLDEANKALAAMGSREALKAVLMPQAALS